MSEWHFSPLYSQNNVYMESDKFSNFFDICNLLESSGWGLEESVSKLLHVEVS